MPIIIICILINKWLYMFVCMCFGITDKQVKNAVEAHGVGNIRELKQVMALGSQCGKCIELAQEIIDGTIIDESLFKDVG
jgi:bacterioferritin-associated ferredoxin